MKPSDLRGIFPPITTPFVDGKVAYDKLAANIEKWNKTGLSGYVAFGSNGEYVYLDDEEKLEVVKTVVQSAASGKKIIAGTGCAMQYSIAGGSWEPWALKQMIRFGGLLVMMLLLSIFRPAPSPTPSGAPS